MSGEMQVTELDLIGGLVPPLEEVGPADLLAWNLRGGCTMPRAEHREHIERLLALGQRP